MKNVATMVWWLAMLAMMFTDCSVAQNTSCLEGCIKLGAQERLLPNAMVCGTDGLNYFVPSSDEVVNCFAACDVAAVYPSVCGCPSDCFSALGQGYCFPSSFSAATFSWGVSLAANAGWLPSHNVSCSCQPGFQGPDCSSPKCGQTLCAANGFCVPGPTAHWPSDSCHCSQDWTGGNCLTPIGHMAPFPFGFLYNNNPPLQHATQWIKLDSQTSNSTPYWTNRTGSGDDNPLFDINRIARVAVELDPQAYLQMLLPANLDTDQYTNCTLYFSNGQFQVSALPVGARVKGSSSRLLWNKGFNFKINAQVSGQTVAGLSKFGVKYSDPALIKSELGCEMVRALNSMPAQRSSFATLSVNGVHHGVLWMAEAVDSKFIGFHYPQKNGNLYEVDSHGFLEYLGPDPAAYAAVYLQKQGNGNYSDLMALCRILNSSYATIDDFQAAIASVFNVEGYLQWLPIEMAIGNSDGYSQKGNNYYLYHNPATKLIDFIAYDLSDTFELFDSRHEAIKSIWNFANPRALLTVRLLQVPAFRQTFIANFELFLRSVWTSPALLQRIDDLAALLSLEFRHSSFYPLASALRSEDWNVALIAVKRFIRERTPVLLADLKHPPPLSALWPASSSSGAVGNIFIQP